MFACPTPRLSYTPLRQLNGPVLQHCNTRTNSPPKPLRNPLQILYTGIAWLWGCCNLAELNRVSRTGLLTVDNEGIKGGTLTENTTFRYNWVPRRA